MKKLSLILTGILICTMSFSQWQDESRTLTTNSVSAQGYYYGTTQVSDEAYPVFLYGGNLSNTGFNRFLGKNNLRNTWSMGEGVQIRVYEPSSNSVIYTGYIMPGSGDYNYDYIEDVVVTQYAYDTDAGFEVAVLLNDARVDGLTDGTKLFLQDDDRSYVYMEEDVTKFDFVADNGKYYLVTDFTSSELEGVVTSGSSVYDTITVEQTIITYDSILVEQVFTHNYDTTITTENVINSYVTNYDTITVEQTVTHSYDTTITTENVINSYVTNYDSIKITQVVEEKTIIIEYDWKLTEGEVTLVNNPETDIDFSFYPNPATDYISIKINSEYEACYLKIYTLSGSTALIEAGIYSNKLVDLSNLSTGTYIIRIESENGEILKSEKLIIR
jgi:hypothetical protein